MAGSSSTGQVALSTAAAKVVDGYQNAPSIVFLYDVDAAITIYWGYTSGVTSSTGVPLPASKGLGIPLDAGESLYAVAASGTPTVAYALIRAQQRIG